MEILIFLYCASNNIRAYKIECKVEFNHSLSLYTYIYIYIYIDRYRYICVCLYIYKYIYVYDLKTNSAIKFLLF